VSRTVLYLALLFVTSFALADTIILRDGTSYTGQYNGGAVMFTDGQGVKYEFPQRDVQSLAFSSASDTVTLRNGKAYSGHFTGITPLSFQDSMGIKYQFPTSDVDALVFNAAGTPVPVPDSAKVIPAGSEVSVHTDETIDSDKSYEGQTYRATIAENVVDQTGNVAIPAGSRAELVIRKIATADVKSPELVLDLYSVTIDKKPHRVVSSDVAESNKKGFGANKRTAELLGGGSALGALLGGVFGGGKGAGIGALAGAGGGFVTQVFTRGKQVKVPAESVLNFRLEKTLVLAP
jgi:uncharacterized protein YcfJ